MVADKITLAYWSIFSDSGADLPKEVVLAHPGINRTTKGDFIFDDTSAEMVMKAYSDHGVDIHIDYEHQAVKYKGTGPVPAAGWCALEVRDGTLYASDIRWTDRATDLLTAKEYRYYSPVYLLDGERRIVDIYNIALTNVPATYNQQALMAASQEIPKMDEDTPVQPVAAVAEEAPSPMYAEGDKCMLGDQLCEVMSMSLSYMYSVKLEDGSELVVPEDGLQKMEVEGEALEALKSEIVALKASLEQAVATNRALQDEALQVLLSAAPEANRAILSRDISATIPAHKTVKDAFDAHKTAHPHLYEVVAPTVQARKPMPLVASKSLGVPKTAPTKSKFEQYKEVAPQGKSRFIGGK